TLCPVFLTHPGQAPVCHTAAGIYREHEYSPITRFSQERGRGKKDRIGFGFAGPVPARNLVPAFPRCSLGAAILRELRTRKSPVLERRSPRSLHRRLVCSARRLHWTLGRSQ